MTSKERRGALHLAMALGIHTTKFEAMETANYILRTAREEFGPNYLSIVAARGGKAE